MNEFTWKLLEEHGELTIQNAIQGWMIQHYEGLIGELISYLCEEDVLGRELVTQYNILKRMNKRGGH